MIRRAAIGALVALPTLPALSVPAAAQELVPEAIGAFPEPTPETEAAELTVVNLLNLFRLENGRPALELDTALTELARIRSTGMAVRNSYSHEIPGIGYGPYWILDHLQNARGSGENLGVSDDDHPIAMHRLFDAWVASPTHHENLLQIQFTHIGVGVVEVPAPIRVHPGRTVKYVSQIFAIAAGPLARI